MNNHKAIHSALLRWYRLHGRKFPWRETRDPYFILVSESMLQQTQTSRVELKLPQWTARFPSVAALARARRSSVIRAWQGMGYNRRAALLHECAKKIMLGGGVVPSSLESLKQLPGIGRYTASAVACFAFGQRVPVVDVNIRRVLSRVMRRQLLPESLIGNDEIWEVANEFLPRKQYDEWNQALMDVGALFCKRRRAECSQCPLQSVCASAPYIQNTNRETSAMQKTKTEPVYLGIPRRIWRGRLVECLRKEKTISIHQAAVSMDLPTDAKTKRWIEELFGGLMRDGLAKPKGAGYSLA